MPFTWLFLDPGLDARYHRPRMQLFVIVSLSECSWNEIPWTPQIQRLDILCLSLFHVSPDERRQLHVRANIVLLYDNFGEALIYMYSHMHRYISILK